MVFKRSCNQLMGSNFRNDLTYHDHYLSPGVHQEKTSEWAATNTRPSGLCTRRLQGGHAISAGNILCCGLQTWAWPSGPHSYRREARTQHLSRMVPLSTRERRRRRASSIANDACLQKVSMHACIAGTLLCDVPTMCQTDQHILGTIHK